jgi:DNA polymerase III delta prime subunit
MTYLFISKNTQQQTSYLTKFVSELLGQPIQSIQETPDIHILDRREENSIGIEEVKEFVKEMIFKPFGKSKQIAIIYAAEKLTPQAQNSFLKTLEESNDDTIYILCVDNEKNVLPTIYSRSKPIYIKQEITKVAQDTKPTILDQDLVEQFEYIDSISKEKVKCLELLNEIEEYFKRELEKEIKNDNINSSRVISERLKYIQETREKINSNCNKKLVLEALLLSLNA